MDERRCWFCGRGRRELIEDLPPGFWDEQQDMFFEVEVVGKVSGVDKVRPGDPPHSRHFRRRDASEDEVHSFDDRRFAVVSRKCKKVSVCRVCRSVETGLTSVSEDGKGATPYRPVYAPGSDELTVARTWERVRLEEKQREAAYPEEAYRALLAIQSLGGAGTVSLWDLSKEMNVFNHRSLERPVTHLLEQCPDLGILDRRALVLQFRDPASAPGLVQGLVDQYERFYEQREARAPAPQPPIPNNDVIARIKKLNNPADSMQYYSKW